MVPSEQLFNTNARLIKKFVTDSTPRKEQDVHSGVDGAFRAVE
jgi:hypothetical protein